MRERSCERITRTCICFVGLPRQLGRPKFTIIEATIPLPRTEGGPLVDFNYADSLVSNRAGWPDVGDSAAERLPPAVENGQFALKRAFDIVVATVGLVLVAPVLMLLALLVKLDSRGPVVFAQARLGLSGRQFRMYKLRTMRVGAEEEKAAMAHLNRSDDSRLFKIPEVIDQVIEL